MRDIQVEIFDSVGELRQQATEWDNLWQRSAVTLPTVRAQPLAQWIETFAPGKPARVIVVRRDGQFVAGLPLVETRVGRVVKAGDLTSNSWGACGDLLLDESGQVEEIVDRLALALNQLPWPLLWMDGTLFESTRWQAFSSAMQRAGYGIQCQERFRVGKLPCGEDWEAFRAEWSANLRKAMNKGLRRLDAAGGYELVTYRPTVDNFERLLREAFEMEHRSWKGEDGGSVIASGMLPYYTEQARHLLDQGQLQISFLQLAGKSIAFEFAFVEKGVYHPMKIGYDPEFASFGPGQMLRHEVLRSLFADPEMSAMDFVGPLGDAVARWKPPTYGVGRMVVAPRKLMGSAVLYAWQHVWPNLRQLRNRLRGSDSAVAPSSAELAES